MINLRQSAIGVLEVSYFANTVVVVDQALKAAQVELVSCHKRLGGKMCHTVLAGSTSGVEAAMEAARAAGMNAFVAKPLDVEYLYTVLKRVSDFG